MGESLIIKLSSVFIFDDPLALLELRLTAASLRGGLNGAVFGDTRSLLVGWGMVVVMGVLEVIRVEDAEGGISSLLMLASLPIVFISSVLKRTAVSLVPVKSSDNHIYRMAYEVKPSAPSH